MTFALKIKAYLRKSAAAFVALAIAITALFVHSGGYQKSAFAGFSAIEQQYIDRVATLVNVQRQAAGLEPLAVYPQLCEAATVRSNEISELFSHDRPNGTSCYTVLAEYSIGFISFGENIAMGYSTPEAVVQGWMDSDGHRANILNDGYQYIGIGYYKVGNTAYWTQLFIETQNEVSGAYIPNAATTTTASATTTTTTTVTTTTVTTPKTTTTTSPKITTTTTSPVKPITTTTTTTTLYALPTIYASVEQNKGENMYFADDTRSLLENSTFEIVVKKPISPIVYSEVHFDLTALVSLDGIDPITDGADGISPCDIYYCSAQRGEYSLNYKIIGIDPDELAELISYNVDIDLEIIRTAMQGKIVDDDFNYLDSVFGTFDTAIALRGDVDLNGVCNSQDAEIVANYEKAYSEAIAYAFLNNTEPCLPTLYECEEDNDTIKALRAFAANVNGDYNENAVRVDNLDAAYIQMFANNYKASCEEIEASGGQLDIIRQTALIWENIGIVQNTQI